ncbi:MAG: JAB domain-containing protein [Bacteroidetes bacterium]|nr:JAB domain-containing protein [Bacteroidota bacterium]
MDTNASVLIPKVTWITLNYRPKIKPSQRPIIKSSRDAYELLRDTWDTNTLELLEQFKILLLNRGNYVLGMYHVSTGSAAGTIADPKIILATAILANATSIVLAHNHPSGNIKPSRADEELTQKIKHAADFLDLKVLDHIIITPESYYSFADEGLI